MSGGWNNAALREEILNSRLKCYPKNTIKVSRRSDSWHNKGGI